MIDKTICELFAGVGGFRLGFERSSKDWKTVWANQWEPGKKSQHAFDCYCHHFGNSENHVNQDISTFLKDDIPDHNLLVGGFPCQDYSVARTGATGIEGKKGVLWWQIRDILEAKKPKFVLLENVDRLLKSPSTQRGRDFGVMLACLNQLDYTVEWRVINAAEYGFAQRRRRVFIFAYKNKTNYGKIRLRDSSQIILEETGLFAKSFPINDLQHIKSIVLHKQIADNSDKFAFKFENCGLMRNGEITTAVAAPVVKEPIILRHIIMENVDEKYFIQDDYDKWKELKGKKHIKRTSKTGHEYIFSEGAIAFPDPLDRPARTMLTSESTRNRSTHIIRDPGTKRLRRITPVEAERIQGFNDNWTNTGMPERFRYFCMGNALVVGVVETLAKNLNTIFDSE